jgi:hypothetical protein
MRTVVKYLEAISKIDAAERRLERIREARTRGRAHAPQEVAELTARIEQAYETASLAWEAITPHLRKQFYPPSVSRLAAHPAQARG